MNQSKHDVDLGRFLSLVLRHEPAAAAMVRDGRTFFRSENGVWLCKEVAWRYVQQILYP